MQALGALGGKYSVAHAINDSGQIVGDALTAAGDRHGFLWQHGKMQDIGTLDKGNTVVACGINSRGQIVGAANVVPNGKNHAFLWEQGTMRDLGLLPGGTYSYGYALNESGEVVGWADDAKGELHAFAWQNDKMQDLGTLGDAPGAAWSVNSQGQIVGTAATEKQRMHAFLYEKGHMSDLNSLVPPGSGWILTTACRINDAGQIAGLGWHGGKSHAFLLTPQEDTPPSLNSAPHKPSVTGAPSKTSKVNAGKASAVLGKTSANEVSPLPRPTFHVRFQARDTEGRPVSPADYKGKDALVCFFCGCSACYRVAQAWAQIQQGGVFAPSATSRPGPSSRQTTPNRCLHLRPCSSCFRAIKMQRRPFVRRRDWTGRRRVLSPMPTRIGPAPIRRSPVPVSTCWISRAAFGTRTTVRRIAPRWLPPRSSSAASWTPCERTIPIDRHLLDKEETKRVICQLLSTSRALPAVLWLAASVLPARCLAQRAKVSTSQPMLTVLAQTGVTSTGKATGRCDFGPLFLLGEQQKGRETNHGNVSLHCAIPEPLPSRLSGWNPPAAARRPCCPQQEASRRPDWLLAKRLPCVSRCIPRP